MKMKKKLSLVKSYLKYVFWIVVALVFILILNLFDQDDAPNNSSTKHSEKPKTENRPESGEIEFKK